MHRDEIIEQTLAIMPYRRDRAAGDSDGEPAFAYDEIVISELERRLLLGDNLKTCEDFAHLSVSCCEICHTLYPHYDMYAQALPEGRLRLDLLLHSFGDTWNQTMP